MAVRVLSMVWDGYPGGGSDLLAILALADWSDDDGRCWPSMAAIARKTRLSRSQAQRIVHQLIDDGFLSVTGNETGGAPGSTRQYQINLPKLTGRTDATPTGRMDATGSAHATGRTHAQDGSHGCAETGRTHATQTVIEPSITVSTREQARSSSSGEGKKRNAITLKAFLDNCMESGEQAIPAGDPIFEYAEKVGINGDMLAAAWAEFKAAYLTTGKQKDWRAHFRNAVRRNWYKLWYLKEGEPAGWTTAGEQARRNAA